LRFTAEKVRKGWKDPTQRGHPIPCKKDDGVSKPAKPKSTKKKESSPSLTRTAGPPRLKKKKNRKKTPQN